MKYIIDVEALKGCFDLLPKPFITDGKACVYLDSIKEMIDKFPKEEYVENVKAYREFPHNANKDILDGKGLKPLDE